MLAVHSIDLKRYQELKLVSQDCLYFLVKREVYNVMMLT